MKSFCLIVLFATACLVSADVDVDAKVGVAIEDINTAVFNKQAGNVVNDSNIVVLSDVNFGTIVSELGHFEAIAGGQLAQLQAQQQEKTELNQQMFMSALNTFQAMDQQKMAVSAEQTESSDDEDGNVDVDAEVDVNIDGINTAVGNLQNANVLNKSNIVVLDKVNFGTIVSQLGHFAAETKGRVRQLAVAEDNGQDSNVDVNANVNVDLENINTVVVNKQDANVLNKSNIVVLDKVNFGTIVSQLGHFEALAQAYSQQNLVQYGQESSEDVNVDAAVNVAIDGVNTAVGNAQNANVVNESNIVVLDKVNFGTIVTQLGHFSAELEQLQATADLVKE